MDTYKQVRIELRKAYDHQSFKECTTLQRINDKPETSQEINENSLSETALRAKLKLWFLNPLSTGSTSNLT